MHGQPADRWEGGPAPLFLLWLACADLCLVAILAKGLQRAAASWHSQYPFSLTHSSRRPYIRGSLAEARRVAGGPTLTAIALQEFDENVFSATTLGPREARLNTWLLLAKDLKQHVPFPLTPAKSREVAAVLGKSQYRSCDVYISRAKMEHISKNSPWAEQLKSSSQEAKRSCIRGIGKAKQATAIPVERLVELTVSDAELVEGGPIGFRDTMEAGCGFVTREIELAAAHWKLVQHKELGFVVSCVLPCSKSDIAAMGTERGHGCSSDSGACDPGGPVSVLRAASTEAASAGEIPGALRGQRIGRRSSAVSDGGRRCALEGGYGRVVRGCGQGAGSTDTESGRAAPLLGTHAQALGRTVLGTQRGGLVENSALGPMGLRQGAPVRAGGTFVEPGQDGAPNGEAHGARGLAGPARGGWLHGPESELVGKDGSKTSAHGGGDGGALGGKRSSSRRGLWRTGSAAVHPEHGVQSVPPGCIWRFSVSAGKAGLGLRPVFRLHVEGSEESGSSEGRAGRRLRQLPPEVRKARKAEAKRRTQQLQGLEREDGCGSGSRTLVSLSASKTVLLPAPGTPRPHTPSACC